MSKASHRIVQPAKASDNGGGAVRECPVDADAHETGTADTAVDLNKEDITLLRVKEGTAVGTPNKEVILNRVDILSRADSE